MSDSPTVAAFRPDDERLVSARDRLQSLDVEPVLDPMLAVEPTGNLPGDEADYTILTSTTGVDIVAGAGWTPAGRLCAIGETTADALRAAGYTVDVVPETYTSAGLVDRLDGEIEGAHVEVARSDHGSAVLLEGLEAAGATVEETILYRLERPAEAGISTQLAAAGDLDGVAFTSSLTVEHFLDAARDRGIEAAVREGLAEAVVGAIGPPTRETAEAAGIAVDVVPAEAQFDELARAVVAEIRENG